MSKERVVNPIENLQELINKGDILAVETAISYLNGVVEDLEKRQTRPMEKSPELLFFEKEIANTPIITLNHFKEWKKKYSIEIIEEVLSKTGGKCYNTLLLASQENKDGSPKYNVPRFAILTSQIYDEIIGDGKQLISEVFQSTSQTGTLYPQKKYNPTIYENVGHFCQDNIMSKKFPDNIKQPYLETIDYVTEGGKYDGIVRSSASGEDGGGNQLTKEKLLELTYIERAKSVIKGYTGGAFAGVGSSITIPRDATDAQKFKVLQSVSASIMNPAGIGDRQRVINEKGENANPGEDEKMSALVQRFGYPKGHENMTDEEILKKTIGLYIFDGNDGGDLVSISLCYGTNSTIADNKCNGINEVKVHRNVVLNPHNYIIDKEVTQTSENLSIIYALDKLSGEKIEYKRIYHPFQESALLFEIKGSLEGNLEANSKRKVQVPNNFPPLGLNHKLVDKYTNIALEIRKDYYDQNMDTEYAQISGEDFVLQARPITGKSSEKIVIETPIPEIPENLEKYIIYGSNEYAKGVAIGDFFTREYYNSPEGRKLDTTKGLIFGGHEITAEDADLYNFNGVQKYGAMVTYINGGSNSHPAAKTRELGIPYCPGLEEKYNNLIPGKKYLVCGYGPYPYILERNEQTLEFIKEMLEWQREVDANSWEYKENNEITPLRKIELGFNVTTAESANASGINGDGYRNVPLVRMFDFYNAFLKEEFKDFNYENPDTDLTKKERIIVHGVKHLYSLAVNEQGEKNFDTITIRNTAGMLKEMPGYSENQLLQLLGNQYGNDKIGAVQGGRFTEIYPGLCEMEFEMVTRAQNLLDQNKVDCQLKFMLENVTSAAQIDSISYNLDLKNSKVPFGIMVEDLKLISDITNIKTKIDFASFGTNDLTQHLLKAKDRGLFDTHENLKKEALNVESLLWYMSIASEELYKFNPNISLSICGEILDSFPELMDVFVEMGITNFNVPAKDTKKMKEIFQRSLILETYHYNTELDRFSRPNMVDLNLNVNGLRQQLQKKGIFI